MQTTLINYAGLDLYLQEHLALILGDDEILAPFINLSYDPSWSHDSGVSFSGTLTPDNSPVYKFPDGVNKIKLVRDGSQYSHAEMVKVECYNSAGDSWNDEEVTEANAEATSYYRSICSQLEAHGYTYMQEYMSEDVVIDNLISEGDIFLASGTRGSILS